MAPAWSPAEHLRGHRHGTRVVTTTAPTWSPPWHPLGHCHGTCVVTGMALAWSPAQHRAGRAAGQGSHQSGVTAADVPVTGWVFWGRSLVNAPGGCAGE